jgi:hypothetical protein
MLSFGCLSEDDECESGLNHRSQQYRKFVKLKIVSGPSTSWHTVGGRLSEVNGIGN